MQFHIIKWVIIHDLLPVEDLSHRRDFAFIPLYLKKHENGNRSFTIIKRKPIW